MADTIVHRQRLYGSATQNDAYTGLPAEITVDTTNKTLRVHDGNTPGGSMLATWAELLGYLPLTGGTITGSILFPNAILRQSGNNGESIMLASDKDDPLASSRLTLNKPDGWFELLTNASGVSLKGQADGRLTWQSKNVERVSAIGAGYIRYESGLQICWGETPAHEAKASGTVTQRTVNFPKTFSSAPCVIAPTSSHWYRTYAGTATVSGFNFVDRSDVGNYSLGTGRFVAFGSWK